MRKTRLISFLLCALLFCSCSQTPADTSSDTNSSDDQNATSAWTVSEGMSVDGNTISTTENTKVHTAYASSPLPKYFTVIADLTFESKGYAKVYIESEFKDDEAESGISITVDTRTNSLLVHLCSKGTLKLQSSQKIEAVCDSYSLKISRLGAYLDVYLYSNNSPEEPVAYSSLKLNRQKGDTHAISLCGKVTMSDYSAKENTQGNLSGTYTNPILSINKDLGDPTVYYEDGKYYMLTTGRMNCYVSEDLVNFTDIGPIADTKSLFGKTYFGGGSIFKHDGIYYLFYTSYKPDTDNTVIMCVATSDNVTGPYTQTKQTMVNEEVCPLKSAGAFAYEAPDKKTYLYWYETISATGNTIFGAEAEFKDGVVTVKKETKKQLVIPSEPWETKSENGASGRVVERPNVFYHNGYYYLFYAGSHWKTSYGQGYAVSTSPLGDFVKYQNNPILDSTSSLHGVGCTYITYSPDKSELFFVYHAHTSEATLTRNVCIDRVIFVKDTNGGADIVKVIGPTVTPQANPK